MGFKAVAAFSALLSTMAASALQAEDVATVAKAFGARPQIHQISLSPDGRKVAMIVPTSGTGDAVMIVDPVAGGTPSAVLRGSGKPDHIRFCAWVTSDRLTCQVAYLTDDTGTPITITRLFAVDSDGKNFKELTASDSSRALGYQQFGGSIIDWTGDGRGSVLMTRQFVPEKSTGTMIHSDAQGLGVERVDTRTGSRAVVEHASRDAVEFITDGRGVVRIMGQRTVTSTGYADTKTRYYFRPPGTSGWQPLSVVSDGSGLSNGFDPYTVDPEKNVVYGFDIQQGYQALFSIALDGSRTRTLVAARPDTDVDGLIRIGRQHRVVGVSYATERREADYFDPQLAALRKALGRALPSAPIVNIVDASADEQKLLIVAGSDTNPGTYYLLDRATKQMTEVLPVRPDMTGRPLAQMKPVRFPAADGTMIPGYLTLPPGSDGRNLPAIVMPHGGPGDRDEWGFDWWAQFFVARGFAVLQPNFRGSTGYGSAWFQKNGFQSWRTAVGDVVDAGRWLKAQGVAAPGKLAIVGWSYGGYAALQSTVLDPDLFKAVIAVAPVTDLAMLKETARQYTNYDSVAAFVGDGPHIQQGSPARNIAAFKAPVLIFHGTDDRNVRFSQSQFMADRLRAANKYADLVVFKGLDHQLDDSDARTMMLTRSDAFLREKLGLDK